MVAGVELRRDGIFSSRLAAAALYTTSPSVAYLRIDLRIHHNRKEHCGGIEPHLHKPHFPDMLLTMPLSVMGSVSWSNGQAINLAPGEDLF